METAEPLLSKYQRYRRAHPERVKAATQRWREANKERYEASQKICRKRWADANPEKNKQSKAAWAAANQDYHREKSAEYVARNPEKVRDTKRRVHLKCYGLTPEQYDEMLLAQNNCCKICGTDNPGRKDRNWSVDHCHTTGRVRGLLCHHCNVGLGHFKDDPDLMIKAASYLRSLTP